MELALEKQSLSLLADKPVDVVIKQLNSMLANGKLNPGDRLLSERKLAEEFEVSRANVREAIKKLEFYGILKTLPQSGTFVVKLEASTLEGLITDALHMENYDFYSLAESRLILETSVVRLAVHRRTEEDLWLMESYLEAYEDEIAKGLTGLEEDLKFHRQIAQASKNQVLKSMMLIISPDILIGYRQNNRCCDTVHRSVAAIEHRLLLEYIRNKDENAAVTLMEQHLKGVMEYAKSHLSTEQESLIPLD